MKDLISRQAVLNLLHALPPEEAMTKAMLIQSVKQMTAPDNLVKDSQGLAKELVNDCISRRAAIDAIKKCRNESDMPDMWYDGMSCALRCIYQLPSAQPKSYREGYQAGYKDAQPEIIRCGECKLRDTEYCNMAHGFMGMKDDDYCSYAERREVSE